MKRSLNVMKVFLAAAAAALVVTEAGIPTANAAGPETTRFSFEDNYVDTYTCPGMSLGGSRDTSYSRRSRRPACKRTKGLSTR